MERVIGHIDLDYFYAQVEEVENPLLRERPVIVCVFSGRTDQSGVVSTANYKARELGVRSGMPIALAKKKLEGRNPAVIRMDHEKYEVVSARIMESLGQMVDILEPTGIDEAFFDLSSSTGGDYAKAKERAEYIKKSIFEDEHLTSSVGMGRSKVVAKLGSDMSKPNGLTIILPEETRAILDPLPVTNLYGIGPKTSSLLEEMGIRTVGELARTPASEIEERFGRKFGAYLLAAATGTDNDPVMGGLQPTQFSRVVTLRSDTRNLQDIFSQLADGIEYVHGKLTSSEKSFRTVTAVGILTDLSAKTRSKTFGTPMNDIATLRETTSALFQELSSSVSKDFRRVGVRVSGLVDAQNQSALSEFLSPAR